MGAYSAYERMTGQPYYAPRMSGYGAPRQQDYQASAPMLNTGDYGSAPSMRMSQSAPAPTTYPMAAAPMLPGGNAPQSYRMSAPDLGAMNRGQQARGSSPGFVSMQAGLAARGAPHINTSMLPQAGENAVDLENRRLTSTFANDANTRANQYGMAQAGLMNAQAGGIGMMAPAEAGFLGAQGRALDTTAPAQAELARGQAKQAAELPADYKTREAGYVKQLKDAQAENARMQQQIRLYQEQGSKQPKTPVMTHAEYLDAWNKTFAEQAKVTKTPQLAAETTNGIMAKWDPTGGKGVNGAPAPDDGRDRISQPGAQPAPTAAAPAQGAIGSYKPTPKTIADQAHAASKGNLTLMKHLLMNQGYDPNNVTE